MRSVVSIGLFLATLCGQRVCAQPACSDSEFLRARFEAASVELEAGAFRGARDVFRELLVCDANPAIAYNLARAHEGLGELVEALRLLRELESQVYGQLPEQQERDVQTLRQRLSVRLVRVEVRVTGPLEYQVFVGDQRLDLREPVTNPGSQTVRVEADGFRPFQRSINPPAGAVVPLDVVLLPVSEAEAQTQLAEPIGDAHPYRARRWGIIAGVLVAGALAVLIAGLTTRTDEDELTHPTYGVVQTLQCR